LLTSSGITFIAKLQNKTINWTKTLTGVDRRRDRICQSFSYQLVGEHKNSLQGKFPTAEVEKIFKTWSQEIKNQYIVVSLNAVPSYIGNPS
jgi:hypothetical protein